MRSARSTGGRRVGQSCLLARRLVEAGVSFVTINDRGIGRLRLGHARPELPHDQERRWRRRWTRASPHWSRISPNAGCSTTRWSS